MSDRYTQPVLDLLCRLEPEKYSALGIPWVAAAVPRLGPDAPWERIAVLEQALRTLGAHHARESRAAVRVDLEAMITLQEWDVDLLRVEAEYMLPYVSLAQTMFSGFLSTFAAVTREVPAAAVRRRLYRYAGLEEGYEPLTRQAEAMVRSRFDDRDLLGPWREALLEDLRTGPRLLEALPKLFHEHQIAGTAQTLRVLMQQLAEHDVFLREELLPRCRDDFRLPGELYAAQLLRHGVELPAAELSRRAEAAFDERRRQLDEVTAQLASERGWPREPFQAVLRRLEREQIDPKRLINHYRRRHHQLEQLVEATGFVTLPRRRPRIRFAGDAESTILPFAHFRWPPAFDRRRGAGQLVLPAQSVDPDGEYASQAASWVLVAHELLPGHALQVSRLLEPDVSLVRGVMGVNSASLEGWAVYAGSELSPELPLEARFLTLHHDLCRAARAFLDPALHLGGLSLEQAAQFLQTRVGLTKRAARQTLWRTTVWSPGQATSYFAGHSQLAALRTAVESRLGAAFDRQRYHDLLLSQGLLPLSLLRRQVLKMVDMESQYAA